ncbi:MAG: hypothetical protein RLY71_1894 [Pseudomonadota bacterium]|jgi:hypothetical protein
MQFSDALEVAIGLTFVFLLVSLALTAIVEFIEAKLKTRGFSLHEGVVELLDDTAQPGSGQDAAKSVYSHPLVQGLYIGSYETAIEKKLLPSYLPSRNFALALIDQVLSGRVNAAASVASLPAQAPLDDRLRLAAERVENEQLRRALLLAVHVGGNDIERITRHLEDWFNGAMERVSGRYKRRSQKWLFSIGLLSAVLLNVNTLTIADALSKDATLRRAVVAQAEATAAQAAPARHAEDTAALAAEPSTAPASDPASGPTIKQTAQLVATQAREIRQIERIGLPIGWTEHAKRMLLLPLQGQDNDDGTPASVPAYQLILGGMHIVLGYLFTALAVSLGAPFWFDMLNRLIVVRGALKSHEKAEQAVKTPASVGAGAAVAAASAGPDAGEAATAGSVDRDIYAEIPEIADKLFEEWH